MGNCRRLLLTQESEDSVRAKLISCEGSTARSMVWSCACMVTTGLPWNNTVATDRNIDAHVRAIRTKLGAERKMIESVRGVGDPIRDVEE